MEPEQYQVVGLPISKTYYEGQELKITHGQFEIRNGSDKEVSAKVQSVEVTVGPQKLEVSEYHLYVLPDFEEVSSGNIAVPANSKITIEASFPFLKLAGKGTQQVKVNLTMNIGRSTYDAASIIQLTVRSPKRDYD